MLDVLNVQAITTQQAFPDVGVDAPPGLDMPVKRALCRIRILLLVYRPGKERIPPIKTTAIEPSCLITATKSTPDCDMALNENVEGYGHPPLK